MPDDVLDTEPVADDAVPALVEIPEDPAEAIRVLVAALQQAQESEAARLEDAQRLAAEFENFRKRSGREFEDVVARASQRVISSLLPVLDSFDGAFEHEAKSPSEELLLAGVQRTFHQMMEVLEREGLATIPTDGEAFDPTVHEAVAGGAGEDLVIASEMRRGYTLGGLVLRPALVAVAPTEEVAAE